jgi:hypothetical protein
MKADLSRVTFDPAKRFSGVMYQQGRVVLDADLNEQHAIESHAVRAEAADVIGLTGVPKTEAGGFAVDVTDDLANLTIEPGRMYAGGVLCELTPAEVPIDGVDALTVKVATWHVDGHDFAAGQWVQIRSPGQDYGNPQQVKTADPGTRTLTLATSVSGGTPAAGSSLRRVTTYDTQPDSYALLTDITAGKAGRYRVYLDVWERLITQLEDGTIREPALGDADTATRTKTVWQVRAKRVGDASAGGCADFFDAAKPGQTQWPPAAPTGTLRADVDPGGTTSPCVLPPTAGFTGLENQLYRVEVRVDKNSGALTGNIDDPDVSFLWQRDNATIVVPVTSFGHVTTVSSLGKDDLLGLADGQTVEALDDRLELAGRPGELFTITVDQELKQVTLDRAPQVPLDPLAHPKLRRWDGQAAIQSPSSAQPWIPVEKGLQLQFGDGTYRHGDYWLIPARTATSADTGSIDWPADDDKHPLARQPDGNRHHYAPLALVDFDGTKFQKAPGTPLDCRAMFPPLTAITAADVSYQSSVCPLGGAATVQQAIEALCADRQDMCTIHVSPGAAWETVFTLVAAGQDAQICFEVGTYQAPATIVLANKGHLTLTGCGPGTKIEAPNNEAVFSFAGCPSVTVRDLSAAGGVAAPGPGQKHLQGALTFESCSQVRVEDVTLSCAGQATKAAACVSVAGDPADTASSVRILHCDLTVGQHQVGILVTDTARTCIEDNAIRVAGQPFSPNAAEWMRSPVLRGSIRDLIIRSPKLTASAAAAPLAAAAAPPAAGGGQAVSVQRLRRAPAMITVPGAIHELTFATVSSIAAVIASVLQQNPAKAGVTGQALTEHVRSVIDRSLLQNPAIVAGARLFRWAGTVVAQNPVVCEQGIVVGGRTAPEVRILGNTIIGAMQGIHVGLSHRGMARGTTDGAGRVTIHGNKLEIRLPVIGLRDRHAIFVGSAASLLIDNNYAAMTMSASVPIEAVRVFGELGRQAILRENHFDGFTIGFIFNPLNSPADKTINQWMVVDNVASNTSPVVQIPHADVGKVNVSNNLA